MSLSTQPLSYLLFPYLYKRVKLSRRWRAQYRNNGELSFPGKGKQRLTPRRRDQKVKERALWCQTGARYIKKSCGHLHQKTVDLFRFIRKHTDNFSVTKMCQILKVSRSGYYQWIKYLRQSEKDRRYGLKTKNSYNIP